jgi:hypothetical protein
MSFPSAAAFHSEYLDFTAKYLPTWFPGVKLQKLGIKTRKLVKEMVDTPFKRVINWFVFGQLD